MELTRRDAIRALASSTATGLAGCAAPRRPDGVEEPAIVETMVAAATVVYPTAVENVEPFVETWLAGRLSDDRRADAITNAITMLDDRATDWYGDPFRELDAETRDTVLREMGVDSAEERPDGTTAERVRYAVVNELLYALYTSPVGGRLAGIENPIGYPGGLESYQRGPIS